MGTRFDRVAYAGNMKRLALLLPAVALAAVAVSQNPNPGLTKAVGKPLPKLSMKTTDGAKLTNASLKGKVVLIDFWATWCGPCKLASPAIQKLHANYGGRGLYVLGNDTFEYGAKGTAAKYRKKEGYTYAFTERNDNFALSLGVKSLPAFVLVDKKGIVRKVWSSIPTGGADQLYTTIEAEVKPLLGAG
jgi:thiol-disulfide isomerase/thioredoxin